MTSMTMVGGLVQPAPQWRLGELGELLRDHMNTKIESLDQLTLYMQRNDADLLYGGRILAQIDAILDDVRRNGISRDLAVAVESARPGTIPKNVQSILTSNYSRTHQKETVAALESWREAGKLGLVVLVITAVLKILSWILSNSNGYKGPASSSADVAEYKAKVQATVDAKVEAVPEAKRAEVKASTVSLHCTSVLEAYLGSINGKVKPQDMQKMAVAALKLDKTIEKVKGGQAIDEASLRAGKSVFTRLFTGMAEDSRNANDVLDNALSILLGDHHFGDAVFTRQGAGKIYALFPESMRKAGIRVPCDTAFTMANNRFGELAAYFQGVEKGFEALRTVDLTAKNADLTNAKARFSSAIRVLNDMLATTIPDVSSKGISFDTMPTVAMTEQQAGTMIGYSEPVQFIGGKILMTAGYESYLNGTSYNLIREKLSLTDGQREVLLGAVCAMADTSNISNNTNVTNMAGYRKLESDVDKLISTIETWQKDVSRNKNVDLNKLGSELATQAAEQRSDSLNLGREITTEYNDSPDFFATLRKHMTYVRQIARGIIGMNRVADNSSRNTVLRTPSK